MHMFFTILDRKPKQAHLTLMMLIVGLCLIGSPAVISGQEVDAAASTVPYPQLEGMENPARSKIESMQQALEGLIEKPDISAAELAEGYGYLGQLFHAYDLLDAAETCYDEAQSRAPEDERWTYFRALVHNSKGDFEAALKDYARASSLNPANSAALIKSGDVLIELGRWREAGERFQQAREIDAENAAALYGLGRVAANEGDFALAAKLFEQVLEAQPEATVVHYPLGQAYRKLGKTEQARTHLGQRGQDEVSYVDPLGVLVSRLAKSTAVEVVLTLAQNSAGFSPEQFLGYALSQLGDIKGAIEELRTAITIHEQSKVAESDPKVAARFHYVLGGLLVNDRRDPEAVTHFNAAIDLDPTLLDARIKAANAFARAEQFPAAASMYGQVLDVDPRNEAALLKRGAVYMKQGNFEGAAEDLSKLVLLAPESGEAQIRLAIAREELGDSTAAIRGLRRALELDLRSDERASTLTRLGNLFRGRGNVAEALANYRAALELNSRHAPALSATAGLLSSLGRYQEAANYFGLWAVQDPQNLRPKLAEVGALIMSDQHLEARMRLESGLKQFPNSLELKDVLVRHLAACPDRSVRDGAAAVEVGLDVFNAVPTPQSAESLAMAYAEDGQFDKAVEVQIALIEEVEAESEPAELQRLQANLKLYQEGKACCAGTGD